MEYRRGIELGQSGLVWQKQWHSSPECESYPTRSFKIGRERPDDDDLCAVCNTKESRLRNAA
jgi:hypothetical protein